MFVWCVKFAAMFLRNWRFPSNQVLNSLRIDRIFTQHLAICEECGESMKRVKGKGISKKLPPHVFRRISLEGKK